MGKKYNNAITTTAGFNYAAQQPLDDRAVVDSYNDLAGLISSGVSYEGMEVYVIADKKSYRLVNEDWKATAAEDFVTESVQTSINNIMSCGTADPNASTNSQYYFKYSL